MSLRLPWVLILAGCSQPLSAEWITGVYGPHAPAAVAETDQVPESSGVIASRTSPDIFWTHNDSGPYPPRVWAFRLAEADQAARLARHRGYVELPGAAATDWEDIAAGPGQTIYIFDGGDNTPCDRTDKRIHRFVEPVIDPDAGPIATSVPYESLRFEYPDPADPARPAGRDDDRYDAECLFVHPSSGDLYVVTKRRNDNAAVARVYKLPAASITWNGDAIHVLQFVADLSAAVPSWVTAGDVDPAGRRVVIRNYAAAFEFSLPQGEPFDAIFHQDPDRISLLGELQGEGICYARDGGDLITTSEVLRPIGPKTFPVFVTPAYLRADFDQDRDVDRADFGHLQRCFTGAGLAQHDPTCADANLDGDTDVDARDFNLFLACLSGAGILPDPQCVGAP